MKKRVIRVAVTLLVGWLLYSIAGVVPIFMSIPLPEVLHTNQTSLPNGYTDVNKLKYDLDRKIIPAGSFDDLMLFHTGNLRHNSYYDHEKDAFHIYSNGETHRMDASDPSDSEVISSHYYGVAIHVGNYEYLPRNNRMATRRGNLMETQGPRGAGIAPGDNVDATDAAELLYAQKTGKITPTQLSALITITHSGKLAGWFPEENTAVFAGNNGGYFPVTIDVPGRDPEYVPIDLQHVQFISPQVLIGYDEAAQAIVELTATTGARKVLVENIPQLLMLNVSTLHDTPYVGGLLDTHTAFIYNCGTGEWTPMELGEDFVADNFVFAYNDFLITMNEDDGFRWKRGEYYLGEARS